ncbi:MAG: hypothetical protein ACRENE_00325 [Polyangiaceae bacterium]
MNRIIATLTVASSILLVACGGGTPAAVTSPGTTAQAPASLDGTSFAVDLVYEGESPIKDVISFDKGQFESSACTSHGFPKWTPYKAERSGTSIAFTVETHNPNGPVIQWTGSIDGAVASGRMQRTIDGKVALGTFRGSAKQTAENSCKKVARICPAAL